jgi:hypothetical protein
LNPAITRQEVVACIAEAREASQITRRPIKMNESEYHFLDVGKKIEKRVNDSLHYSFDHVGESDDMQQTASAL